MLIYNPMQAVLVTCKGMHKLMGRETEKHDILPLTWHSPASSHPAMYAIFVQKDLMAASIIRESRAFVVNFMPYGLTHVIQKAQSISGEYADKIDELGVHEERCEKLVDSFRIKEALGYLECEVVEEKEAGDHILFLGRVVHSYLDHDDRRPFHLEKGEFTTTK